MKMRLKEIADRIRSELQEIKILVVRVPSVFFDIKRELLAFADFLEESIHTK